MAIAQNGPLNELRGWIVALYTSLAITAITAHRRPPTATVCASKLNSFDQHTGSTFANIMVPNAWLRSGKTVSLMAIEIVGLDEWQSL